MAKKQAKADTPAKRLLTKEGFFPESKKPYWETLIRGVALGYRKQPTTTRWLVRYKDPNATNAKQPYAIEAFGYPDDQVNIDAGREVITYDQAQDRAKEIAKARMQAAPTGPVVITVGTIVERYIKMRDERDRHMGRARKRSDANIRLSKYVLNFKWTDKDDKRPLIADVKIRDLTEKILKDWCVSLNDKLTTKKNEPITFTTKRRLVNDFRAALNSDFVREDYKPMLPQGYADIVRDGLTLKAKDTAGARKASSRPIQFLTPDQFRAVMVAAKEVDELDGWEGDLYRLIVALAATGMRFSQVARMTVSDAHADDFSLTIPASLKGGDSAYEEQTPIKRLVAESDFRVLRPVGDDRPDSAPLLERWRSAQESFDPATKRAIWTRVERGPWRDASELVRPWKKIKERAQLPDGFIPYSFRHTSIIRMLKARLSASHVASLHNTSEAMLKKHYLTHIRDALTEVEQGVVVGVAA